MVGDWCICYAKENILNSITRVCGAKLFVLEFK